MRHLKYLSRGLFVVGLALLLLASLRTLNGIKLTSAGARAQGHVVEVLRTLPHTASKPLAPELVVRLTTPRGEAVSFTDSAHSRASPHAVGQAFEVLYEPGNPSNAAINQFRSLWLIPLQLGLMGFVLWLMSFVFSRAFTNSGQALSPQP